MASIWRSFIALHHPADAISPECRRADAKGRAGMSAGLPVEPDIQTEISTITALDAIITECCLQRSKMGITKPAQSLDPHAPETRPNGLPRRRARPHQAVRHHRGDRQGARAESGRPRRDRARRRRAGFRHAGQHQGGRHQGDRDRQGGQIHRRRRHPRTEGRDRGQVQARERARLQAVADHRRHRRQAGAVQRADGDDQSGRRGHHPGALLGQLSGDRGAARRHARSRS